MGSLATDVTGELMKLEASLARLKEQLCGIPPPVPQRHIIAKAVPIDRAKMARLIYRMRRRRDDLFGAGHFGEPAWDILLDLYIAHTEAKIVAVSSVCVGACVPTTTALRWITMLVEEGLITRTPDPNDGRRAMLGLTAATVQAIEAVLESFGQEMAGLFDQSDVIPFTAARPDALLDNP